jgi:hypothetical protein
MPLAEQGANKEACRMPVTEISVNLPNAIGAPPPPADEEIVVRGKPSRFAELVDVANPLQHVPMVSDIYRAKTGDTISDGAKLGGHVALGAVAGGPVGAIVGVGVFVLEKLFGGDGKASQTAHVGLSIRSEDSAAAAALSAGGTERMAPASPLAAKRPQMTSSEFAALLGSFEAARANDDTNDDAAQRMRANLDKLDELKTPR